MTKTCAIITKYTNLEITIQTKDTETHARMCKLAPKYDRAIEQGIAYLRGQFKSIEQQFEEELRVG